MVYVNTGADAAPLPDINNSVTAFPGSRGGGVDVLDLHKAMGLVGPNALQAQAGTPLTGLPPQFPACSDINYGAQTTHTRCYTFGDGKP
jgi:hypothetical protein